MKLFILITSLIILTGCFDAVGQKLPATQERGRWIPSASKIDGKFLEWNDSLAAYSKVCRLEYLIANDSSNLYLAFRAKDTIVIGKIMAGGITFTVRNVDRQSKNIESSINFPVGNFKEIQSASRFMDPVAIRKMILQLKEFKVKGMKGITDSLLFIVNDNGIKAKLSYTNKQLFYEMILPLQLAELNNDVTAFDYTIRLNGQPPLARWGEGPDAPVQLMPFIASMGMPADVRPGTQKYLVYEMMAPNDFSGKYILVKK